MSKKRILIISLIVLFLIAVAGLVFWFMQKETKTEEETVAEEWEPKILSELNLDDRIESIAFSPDGSTFAVGQYLKADLYNASDNSLINSFEFSHTVEDLKFSPDGKILGGGVTLGGVTLYDVETKEEIVNFHRGYNSRLAFSPDGKTVATGNREGVVWLWDIETGEQIATFEPEEKDYSSALDFSRDGNYVAYGDFGGNVYYWDVESGDLVYTFELPSIIKDVKVSPDGKTLAVISKNKEVDLFDLTSGEVKDSLQSDSAVTKLVFSPDGKMLIVGGNVMGSDGNIDIALIWETEKWTKKSLKHSDIEASRVVVSDVDFSQDSQKVVISTSEGSVYLWQVQK